MNKNQRIYAAFIEMIDQFSIDRDLSIADEIAILDRGLKDLREVQVEDVGFSQQRAGMTDEEIQIIDDWKRAFALANHNRVAPNITLVHVGYGRWFNTDTGYNGPFHLHKMVRWTENLRETISLRAERLNDVR